ncbi:MAG TPA: HDIG domain-containing protein [Thermomicrobiales bacterium]|nr:hypothetical protein [Chloroflexota bacterium]HCG30323.1 hypothetical protein [Chloroflexota bacterium]HQZ88526.1 HDIG domain-containing protein [Thermomicrobiales bacterium]HRA30360.1 HDIG domain-containing protein [Thermomicrobiales bacterium]
MSDIRPARWPWRDAAHVAAIRRFRQGLTALTIRPDREVDARLCSLVVDERQWTLLARLSSFDRAHHLAVYDTLVAGGCGDQDVLRAALLHDVGKANAHGRVWLAHRVIYVLGERWMPALLGRVAREHGRWLRRGVWLSIHHAKEGAALAHEAGANRRVCELIRWHDGAGGAADDTGLSALRRADEGSVV